jgi:hypothetical protein
VTGSVRVQKRKWPRPDGPDPRVVSYWSAHTLATDRFGTWLGCPAAEPHYRPDGSVAFRMPAAGVQLMSAGGWWTAWWWQSDRAVTVDICTRPRLAAGTWSYVDLEVDVVLRRDGSVLVLDENEFADLVRECGVPGSVVAAVHDTTAEVRALLSRPAAPVVEAGWARLAAAVRSWRAS